MSSPAQYSDFIAAVQSRRSAWLGSHEHSDGRLGGFSGISGERGGKVGKFVRHGFQKIGGAFERLIDRGGERNDERCVRCGKVGRRQGHSPAGDR